MQMLSRVLILFNSIKYLKIKQLLYRFIFSFKIRFYKPIITRLMYSSYIIPLKLNLINKPCIPSNNDFIKKEFIFLNQKYRFQSSIAWNNPQIEKLWLYNLHYFDFLLPLTNKPDKKNYYLGKEILIDWISRNPIGAGNGWEPYPISVRIVNWIFFYDKYYRQFKDDEDFKTVFLTSLFQQSKYLTYFLEYHILANHLFANLKALIWAGIFFRQLSWLKRGFKLLEKELKEQILSDGGHYELSPMYHSVILMDILDLLNLFKSSKKRIQNFIEINKLITKMNYSQVNLEKIAQNMLYWLKEMIHPDGQIPLFGDSAFNVIPTYDEIKNYYQQLVEFDNLNFTDDHCVSLSNSGYFILNSINQKMIIDGGILGVDYQPGHAHCDLLSYEYSLKGSRFIVDSGPGNYLPTKLRQKARSIYSHNTVIVNQLEQAELWETFRMGNRVKPEKSSIKIKAACQFDGIYSNNLDKQYSYTHHRRVQFVQKKYFVFEDFIRGNNIRSVESMVHLHPNCKIKSDKSGIRITQRNIHLYLLWDTNTLITEIKKWFYVPEFGKVIQSLMIVFKPNIDNFDYLSYVIVPLEFIDEARKYLLENNRLST